MKKLIIAMTLSLASASSVSAASSTFAEAIGRAVTGYSGNAQVQQVRTDRGYTGFQPWAGRQADLLDDSRVNVVQVAAKDPKATRNYFESRGFMPARYQ